MQAFSQVPTAGNTPLEKAWPIHGKHNNNQVLDDKDMVGSHRNDKVTLHNAHPHTSHSVGYHDSPMGSSYENHGIEAVHIMHGRRDKPAEHHPPKGLWEPDALDHRQGMQTVFGGTEGRP
jgi:hypothetical protein